MSVKKSIYEELILESNDQKRTVDIRTGTVSIDYYEDIFSPSITAKIQVGNTGDSIQAQDNEGKPRCRQRFNIRAVALHSYW